MTPAINKKNLEPGCFFHISLRYGLVAVYTHYLSPLTMAPAITFRWYPLHRCAQLIAGVNTSGINIKLRVFGRIRNDRNGILRGPEETESR